MPLLPNISSNYIYNYDAKKRLFVSLPATAFKLYQSLYSTFINTEITSKFKIKDAFNRIRGNKYQTRIIKEENTRETVGNNGIKKSTLLSNTVRVGWHGRITVNSF